MPPATQSPTTNRILQSFARGLPSYHGAATAQAQIARLLAETLAAAGAPAQFHRALEFGCGTGLLTAQILQRFVIDHLTMNDLVPQSMAALQPILRAYPTTQTLFCAGPIETLPLPENLDLIVSGSTVQWVADPAALMARLTENLAHGGWMALSGFGRGHFKELRDTGGDAKAPSCLDPQDWQAILPARMTVHALTAHQIELRFPTAIALLRHLRQTGVNAHAARHWTRADLARFDSRLRETQPDAGPLTLTYCPVILVAQAKV